MSRLRTSTLALFCSCVCVACPSGDEESSSETEPTGAESSESGTDPTLTTETETSGDGDGDGNGDGDGDPCTPVAAVALERVLARTQLPSPLPAEDSADLLVDMPSSIGSDDTIYLVADSNLNGLTFTTQFMFLVMDLSEMCGLNLAVDLFDAPPLVAGETTVVDMSSGEPVVIEQVEYGADGVTVWEISEVELQDDDCGPTVKSSISYAPELSPYGALWNYTNVGDEVRSLTLYVGGIAEVCL